MSQIEETLARISKMGGVEGFVITDSEGVVVRQSKSFTDEQAAMYSLEVLRLTNRARHFVRDLDPKVRMGYTGDVRVGLGWGLRPLPGGECDIAWTVEMS
jgi:hypothetical protein